MSSDLGVAGRVSLAILTFVALTSIYALVIWRVWRRAGSAAATGFWLACALAYGLLRFRSTCAQPLTCDVGGYAYALHLVPLFTAVGAATLGAAMLVLVARRRRLGNDQPGPAELSLALVAALAAWIVTSVLAARAW